LAGTTMSAGSRGSTNIGSDHKDYTSSRFGRI